MCSQSGLMHTEKNLDLKFWFLSEDVLKFTKLKEVSKHFRT